MRTRILLLGACLVSCTSAWAQKTTAPAIPPIPSREYSGVYVSSPGEDRFTPCGIDGEGDTWSLRFRDNESQAPFLKNVTAVRGSTPLTHFIRVRGRFGPPGRYNVGFQTRELTVDSVLDVKESLEPCAGFGTPAAWSRMPARFRDLRGVALSADRRLAALMDIVGRITVWSTETGELVRKLGSVAKGNVSAASYGPMTFSDDGTLLAVGGIDGIVRVWRPGEGKRVFSLALKDSTAIAKERAKIPPRTNTPGWTQPSPPNSYSATSQLVFNRAMLDQILDGKRAGIPPDSLWPRLARTEMLFIVTPLGLSARGDDSVAHDIAANASNYRAWDLDDYAAQISALRRYDVSVEYGDLRRAAARVKAPMLAVYSWDDHMVTPDSMSEFARMVGADTLSIASTCGHIMIFCEQKRVGAATRAFIAR